MIALVFALIAAILFVELSGVQVNFTQKQLDLLPKEQVVTKTAAYNAVKQETLLLYSTADKASSDAYGQFEVILSDMKWGTKAVNLAKTAIPSLANYKVVIILFSDLSYVGDRIIDICRWVQEGGNVYFPLTIDQNAYSSAIENKLGIEASYEYTLVDHIYVDGDFMVGGGKAFAVPDAYESARTVQLSPKTTKIYAREGDEQGVPLIWEAAYGKGKFVVNNFGMCDKAYRGFFAASLSLFGEVSLYPVINGSTFYLDDFPSQIPSGNSTYITRDFGTTIRDFYINIWWPDMMNLSDKYGLKYTGLAIECYDDAVDGTTDAQPDTGTFLNFGNMLLRKGGELGYHGYNHQPLALGNKDYKDIYDYKTWQDMEAMEKAFGHLVDFCDELFPDVKMAVYVPPSNLLAEEGKQMLLQEFPQVTTLSGIYLPDDALDFALLQEYEVDENGVVDQPRIISGCDIDDFMTMGAFSELNMHYVNNHFTHPDDSLDPERGAELGWKELKNRFDSYLSWLYTSAPNLRNFTGTEFSAAVQRFAAVIPEMQVQDHEMVLRIDNFYDDAQFLVRFNEKEPGTVTGGKLTRLAGDLYLLEADRDTVTVRLK
ncbi:MAG: DUF2194 domain-containing protein [Oscillospiraceae bacterium]|nr:DUF2194 domain-containing protein [Oscillospiraceae bacterium]